MDDYEASKVTAKFSEKQELNNIEDSAKQAKKSLLGKRGHGQTESTPSSSLTPSADEDANED